MWGHSPHKKQGGNTIIFENGMVRKPAAKQGAKWHVGTTSKKHSSLAIGMRNKSPSLKAC